MVPASKTMTLDVAWEGGREGEREEEEGGKEEK